ncbi:hypothetical protein JNUCC0626_19945 [Lentzea sp. JNUCC 0626]|uniref:hypothetical protein n=1 Tax=Lentzea sp. JNUCC 0626 TaxID=3367513 RepID=UPI0037488459
MLYFANASSPTVRAAMAAGEIGMMCTPAEGRSPAGARVWAADNGCYGQGYPGDVRWLKWLAKLQPYAGNCRFAVAPDVFDSVNMAGDAGATLAMSVPLLPEIEKLGYRPAFAAQDGTEDHPVPWDRFAVLFLAGSTSWKLGEPAAALAAEALHRGKTVHMGRVNSRKRWLIAERLGCASADGTFLAYGPDTNLQRMRRWSVTTADTPPAGSTPAVRTRRCTGAQTPGRQA